MKWNPEHSQQLQELYKRHQVADLAKIIGFGKSTIERKMRELNLHRPTGKSINQNFFQEWNRESAYWIGFTLADGNIINEGHRHHVRWHLSMVDVSHLELLKRYLDCEIDVRIENEKMCYLSVAGEKICNDLVNMHIVPNKSYKDEVVAPPKVYFWHFLRGFIDGDGSITYKETPRTFVVTIYVGPYNKQQFLWFKSNLERRCFNPNVQITDKMHVLTFRTQESKDLCHFMYQGSKDLRLKRKYLNYLKIKRWQ
jgi:hypothetical protein